MRPDDIATAFFEALEDVLAFDDSPWEVVAVHAPANFSPDEVLRIELRRGDLTRTAELPIGTATAYIADEEAAVDAFEHWLRTFESD